MKATKIFIALAATAAISLAVIGVAYGYYVNNQTGVNANSPYATTNTNTGDGGFWGWLGGCFGWQSTQPYNNSYHYQPSVNDTAQPPAYVPPQMYQPQKPNQNYYQSGYGRGCWGW
jgi:hypothetical protein